MDSRKKQKKQNKRPGKTDRPISEVYSVIDNDLARDNIENDLSTADLEDL